MLSGVSFFHSGLVRHPILTKKRADRSLRCSFLSNTDCCRCAFKMFTMRSFVMAKPHFRLLSKFPVLIMISSLNSIGQNNESKSTKGKTITVPNQSLSRHSLQIEDNNQRFQRCFRSALRRNLSHLFGFSRLILKVNLHYSLDESSTSAHAVNRLSFYFWILAIIRKAIDRVSNHLMIRLHVANNT